MILLPWKRAGMWLGQKTGKGKWQEGANDFFFFFRVFNLKHWAADWAHIT